jgi:large subunit ribosomal protein L3
MQVSVEFICRKLGMTQRFLESGDYAPVSVLEAITNTVVDKKTEERDHYCALQVGVDERTEKALSKAELGHFKSKDIAPQSTIRECRVTAEELGQFEIGQELDATMFDVGHKVDVIGSSKGRGFTGVVKRHGFKIKKQTHGTHESFRHAGSIGAGATPGHVIKGMKMAGQHGNAQVTVRNLEVVAVDREKNLIFVRGGVPGHREGLVSLRHSLTGN